MSIQKAISVGQTEGLPGLGRRVRNRLGMIRRRVASVLRNLLATLGKLVPASLSRRFNRAEEQLELAKDYLYDARRFRRHAMRSESSIMNLDQMRARILMRAHSIEKGLALPSVKPLFGKEKLGQLVEMLDRFEREGHDRSALEYRKALSAIRAYVEHHRAIGIDAIEAYPTLKRWAEAEAEPIGGTMEVTREAVHEGGRADFERLALSRYSIRQFERRAVEPELIAEAVRIAQKTPSVCNRQGGRVHVLRDPELKMKALKIQGGGWGFAGEIDTALVVTVDLSVFVGSRERNQAFIDGGLFAMSLMYALHAKGLGSCPLNWSTDRQKDRRFRSAVPIPTHEVIIMLIGVGHLRDRFSVARSARKPLDDILTIH